MTLQFRHSDRELPAMRLFFLTFLFATSYSNALLGQVILPDQRFDSLRNSLLEWAETASSPALSIAVSHRGEIIWQESLGWQDTARTQRVNTASRMPIASITKPFTATAIMLLVDQGLLKLDDPVSKHLGEDLWTAYSQLSREPTILDLLQHTAGMEMYYRNVYRDEPPYPSTYSTSARTLIYQPGERFSYSNVGYAMLGQIIGKVSGASYSSFLQTAIFDPLGLANTGVRYAPELASDFVQLRGIHGEPLPMVQTDTEAAGDIYSTAADLLKFGLAHLEGSPEKLLPLDALLNMREAPDTAIAQLDPCQPYGLGWFVDGGTLKPENRAFWHEGGLDGAGSILKVIPAEELVVSVIVNTTFTKSRTAEIAEDIISTISPGWAIPSCPEPAAAPGFDTTHFQGVWKGQIFAGQDTIPLELTMKDDGEIRAFFYDYQTRVFFTEGQPLPKYALAHYPSGNKDRLTCWLLEGLISAPEWASTHHIVQLELSRKGNDLSGTAKAFQTNNGREGKAATFFLALEKVVEGEE